MYLYESYYMYVGVFQRRSVGVFQRPIFASGGVSAQVSI